MARSKLRLIVRLLTLASSLLMWHFAVSLAARVATVGWDMKTLELLALGVMSVWIKTRWEEIKRDIS